MSKREDYISHLVGGAALGVAVGLAVGKFLSPRVTSIEEYNFDHETPSYQDLIQFSHNDNIHDLIAIKEDFTHASTNSDHCDMKEHGITALCEGIYHASWNNTNDNNQEMYKCGNPSCSEKIEISYTNRKILENKYTMATPNKYSNIHNHTCTKYTGIKINNLNDLENTQLRTLNVTQKNTNFSEILDIDMNNIEELQNFTIYTNSSYFNHKKFNDKILSSNNSTNIATCNTIIPDSVLNDEKDRNLNFYPQAKSNGGPDLISFDSFEDNELFNEDSVISSTKCNHANYL